MWCFLKSIIKVKWYFLYCCSKTSFRQKAHPAPVLWLIPYKLPLIMPTSVSSLETKFNATWNRRWEHIWMRHAVLLDRLLIYLCQTSLSEQGYSIWVAGWDIPRKVLASQLSFGRAGELEMTGNKPDFQSPAVLGSRTDCRWGRSGWESWAARTSQLEARRRGDTAPPASEQCGQWKLDPSSVCTGAADKKKEFVGCAKGPKCLYFYLQGRGEGRPGWRQPWEAYLCFFNFFPIGTSRSPSGSHYPSSWSQKGRRVCWN